MSPICKEPPFTIADTDAARAAAEELFAAVSERLREHLPASAQVLHIGATSIPGCLTKGDLDVVVRVPAGDFEAAAAALGSLYAPNEGSVRTPTFAAFEDSTSDPPLGVQLAVIGESFDSFHLFAEVLRRSPPLLEEYNSLKRRYEGAEMATYRAAKDAFIETVLGCRSDHD